MSIFDLLGAAGAGLTRGAVQGEQYKHQAQQQDEANKYKNALLDMERNKLKQSAASSARESQDKLRDIGLKAAVASLEFFNNSQNAADHDSQAAKVGGKSSYQLRMELGDYINKVIAGKEPGNFPVPSVLEKVAAHETAAAAQAQPQDQNQYPPNAQTMTNVPGMEQYINKNVPQVMPPAPAPNLYSPTDYNNTPQLKALLDQEANGQPGGVSVSDLPPQAEAPNIVPSTAQPPGFVPQPPKTAAEIAYKKDAAGKQRSGAAYDEARTRTEDIKQLNQKKADEALIHQREGAARASNATADATPARVTISSGTAAETVRHNQEVEKNQRDQLTRQKALDGVESLYKRAQTKKTLADWQKVKDGLNKVSKAVKFTPDEQAEFQYLKENATSKSKITGKVQNTPGYNDRMESFLSKMKTKYGKQVAEPSTTPAASPTKANLPAKLSDFFQDDVAEVKKNLRNFDGWVNSLSPEAQETAKAIRAMMR